MTRLVLNIPDINCPACVMHLEGLEDELPGIQSIKASYHKKRLEIDFDENQIDEQSIRQAVIETGYEIA